MKLYGNFIQDKTALLGIAGIKVNMDLLIHQLIKQWNCLHIYNVHILIFIYLEYNNIFLHKYQQSHHGMWQNVKQCDYSMVFK